MCIRDRYESMHVGGCGCKLEKFEPTLAGKTNFSIRHNRYNYLIAAKIPDIVIIPYPALFLHHDYLAPGVEVPFKL